jgi:hypothetical protein
VANYCYKCRNELEFIVKVGIKVGRLDTCPHCAANLHCCKNCRFHDARLHNECQITAADFVRDREEPNFCNNFQIADLDQAPKKGENVEDAKAKLNALFKNIR